MVTRLFFRFLLIVSFSGGAIVSYATSDTLVIEDLRHSWMSNDGAGWKPVSDPGNTAVIVVPINFKKHSSSSLIIVESATPIDVWINDRLWEIRTRKWVYSLAHLPDDEERDQVFIQLTSPGGFETLSTKLAIAKKTSGAIADFDLLIKKSGSQFNNFLVIYVLFIILYSAFFRRYFALKFSQIVKWRPKLRKLDTEESFSGILTIDNALTVLLIGFLTSFTWIYYRVIGSNEAAIVSNLYQLWMVAMGAGLCYLIIKIIFIRFFASIFNFRVISGIQLVEFLNYTCAISILIFLLVLIDYSLLASSHWFISRGLIICLIATILFFQPWIYMKFNRTVPNSKILIISYLCLTEFLPGFLLVVWIIR